MLPPTFADRFCARFKRAPSEFERTLFLLVYYPFWVPVARLLLFLFPSIFKIDLEALYHVGRARSMTEVLCEAKTLIHWYKSAWFRRLIRFRLSGRRIVSLGNDVFVDEAATSPAKAKRDT